MVLGLRLWKAVVETVELLIHGKFSVSCPYNSVSLLYIYIYLEVFFDLEGAWPTCVSQIV